MNQEEIIHLISRTYSPLTVECQQALLKNINIIAPSKKKMEREILGLSVKQQAIGILLTGVLVSLMIIYGLTNGFTGVEIPEEYHIMIGK